MELRIPSSLHVLNMQHPFLPCTDALPFGEYQRCLARWGASLPACVVRLENAGCQTLQELTSIPLEKFHHRLCQSRYFFGLPSSPGVYDSPSRHSATGSLPVLPRQKGYPHPLRSMEKPRSANVNLLFSQSDNSIKRNLPKFVFPSSWRSLSSASHLY